MMLGAHSLDMPKDIDYCAEPDRNPSDWSIPLVSDVDGTIIVSDLLWESAIRLCKESRLHVLLFPIWLMRGRPYLKRRLAEGVNIVANDLDYRADVVALLADARRRGRKLVIATAADMKLARLIAAHLGVKDVFATEGTRNLKGRRKAALLRRIFGEYGFDYVGDSEADLAVWRYCRKGYVVGTAELADKVRSIADVERVFPGTPAIPIAKRLAKLLRVAISPQTHVRR